jgi:hypothetical protein
LTAIEITRIGKLNSAVDSFRIIESRKNEGQEVLLKRRKNYMKLKLTINTKKI